jgi:hypothetical protein
VRRVRVLPPITIGLALVARTVVRHLEHDALARCTWIVTAASVCCGVVLRRGSSRRLVHLFVFLSLLPLVSSSLVESLLLVGPLVVVSKSNTLARSPSVASSLLSSLLVRFRHPPFSLSFRSVFSFSRVAFRVRSSFSPPRAPFVPPPLTVTGERIGPSCSVI